MARGRTQGLRSTAALPPGRPAGAYDPITPPWPSDARVGTGDGPRRRAAEACRRRGPRRAASRAPRRPHAPSGPRPAGQFGLHPRTRAPVVRETPPSERCRGRAAPQPRPAPASQRPAPPRPAADPASEARRRRGAGRWFPGEPRSRPPGGGRERRNHATALGSCAALQSQRHALPLGPADEYPQRVVSRVGKGQVP